MKTLIVVLCCASLSWACPKGSYEYEGNCVVDIRPEAAPSVEPSNEKPPRSGLPSWQDPSIHALTPPSLAQDDEKRDRERNDADAAGKKLAGLR